MTRAPNTALVLGQPVEAQWAPLSNALTRGDDACVLAQDTGGWRRGAPVTPDDLVHGAREVPAALMALPQL